MVEIERSEVIKKLIEGLRIHPAALEVPKKIAKEVQPVFQVNQDYDINVIKSYASAGTGAFTVYTTPAKNDFYLVGFSLFLERDANCDLSLPILEVFVNGEAIYLFQTRLVTGENGRFVISMTFPQPIKLDKNSTIKYYGTYTAGNAGRGVTIYGHERTP